MNLSELFGKTAEKKCPCCGGTGEHDTGSECDLCDGGRTVSDDTKFDGPCAGTRQGKTAASPAEESQYHPEPVGRPDDNSYTHDQGVHRGMAVVLPKHLHDFVHDPNQPAPAKAHLLLSEVRKQNAKNQGPEGEEGSAGGLGNYWSPSLHKAAEYPMQAGYGAYREHENEHRCGDEEYGDGGCPTTHVVIHADTPPEKHHWTEQYRYGEQYDPAISWRLPVRPGAPIHVRGVSWREGNDHWDPSQKYSEEGTKFHTHTPFTRYDFANPVRKKAGADEEWPELSMESDPHSVVCRAISRTADFDEATQKVVDETSQSWHTTLHYDAENRWSDNAPKRRYASHGEAQQHADEIADKEGVPRLLVGRNSHGSNWSFYSPSHSANLGGPVIALGGEHLHEDKLIHEMAHHVHTVQGKPEDDDHGPGFTDRYIKMLQRHHSGGGNAAFGFIQSLRSTRHRMIHNNEYENSYTFKKPYPPVPESEKPKPFVPDPPQPDETGHLHGDYTWRRPPKTQTGGMKWPYQAHIIAEHPEHGEVGRLTYFPPKRKGGIARVDNVSVHPDHRRQGLASALMDQLQTRHPGSRMDYGGPNNLNDDGAAWLKGYHKDKTVTRGRTMAALDPASKPHQAATAMAQKILRQEHPETANPLPYSEAKASERLQGVLRAHGHPQADTAFVVRHEDPSRGSSQCVYDSDTGDIGVALHERRYDYGTLAHEAGHLLDIHRSGKDIGKQGSYGDEEIHGDGFRQGYHDALAHLMDDNAANTFTRNYRKHLRVMKEDPGRYKVGAVSFGPGNDWGHIGETEYDEDDGSYKRLWDGWHPKLEPVMHRHLAVELPSDHLVHDSSRPLAERARALVEHAGQGYYNTGGIGHHWTDDPNYDHLSTGSRMIPGQTRAILHARTVPREHVEDNEYTLHEDRAVRDWDTDPEREVPVKRNAPVSITGVTWQSHDGTHSHTFEQPVVKRANIIEVRERARQQHGACPNTSCSGWRGHAGNCWFGGWGYGYGGGAAGMADAGGDTGGGDVGEGGDMGGGDMGAEASLMTAYAPSGTMGQDNEGHRVQMTTMDGWAHDDGSHGHEDNTTIGDHPVYTQTHTWLPNGRYWGPNSAQNDQRLFDGDHLKPEVRKEILDRMNGFMRSKYREWPTWTKVYFAGSEAAQWQPFNGDFDILVGIEYEGFRKANPQYADQDNVAISKMVTDQMRREINEDGYWFTLKDGRKVGPFDRTFYVNPDSYDIRKLKPYAAYNVTDDTWAVHPLQVPKDWDATHLPESYWTYAEALLNEVKAIGTLPPEERHRMAANLWEELHTHRSDAFGPEGKGMFDLSNIVEKYLDQHPDQPWAKLIQWKNEAPSGPEPWVPTTARRITLTDIFSTSKKEPEGADYDGIMIAIIPPKSIGKKLLVEGGEPLEALHVTLAYLGSSKEHTEAQMDGLESLVTAWARTQKPLTAKVGGVGTFTNPGNHVLWAAVDIPRGGGFRHSLSELLEANDYKVRNDYGWTPHITLKYHTSHVRFLPKVEPATWDVKEIMLCIGARWKPIQIGG